MPLETMLFAVFCALVSVVYLLVTIWRRRRKESSTQEVYERLKRKGAAIPVTLHPVFDPARCIGSGGCTRVCPQGDAVIGVLHGRGALVDPTLCIGHGRCAAECPTGAIRLVFGTAERGAAIPELTPEFESNVEGLYITGELGGMGLVTNAIRQAAEAMDNVEISLKETPGTFPEDIVDVAIVGAGPAGMTSALCAVQKGLRYRLFDRETTFGGAIANYPRHKIVVLRSTPVPLSDPLKSGEMTKEELIAFWENSLTRNKVVLDSSTAIDRIEKDEDGIFTLFTGDNRTVARARTIMLTVGRRGAPRRLGVPGENLHHVVYGLKEATEFLGRTVVVVGAGETAVETVCALAEESDAQVIVSIRRDGLVSNNPFNQKRLDAALAGGRVKVVANSTVRSISPRAVELEQGEQIIVASADDVIVNVGGEPPSGLLERCGVSIRMHHGDEIRPSSTRVSRVFETIRNPHHHRLPHRVPGAAANDFSPMPALILAVLLAAFLIAVISVGHHHYLLFTTAAEGHPQKDIFVPSGIGGHTLGVIAAAMILFNLSYLVRKELSSLQAAGSLRTWIAFHMILGLSAGVTTLLHTSFIAQNIFAVFLYCSIGLVVFTGAIGRYLYAFIPIDPRGRSLAHSSLLSLSQRMESRFGSLFADVAEKTAIQNTLNREFQPSTSALRLISRALLQWPRRYLSIWLTVRRARRHLDLKAYREFRIYSFNMLLLRIQLEAFPPLRKFFGMWRGLHGLSAILMIFLIIAHVIIEVWVGYRWIF